MSLLIIRKIFKRLWPWALLFVVLLNLVTGITGGQWWAVIDTVAGGGAVIAWVIIQKRRKPKRRFQ